MITYDYCVCENPSSVHAEFDELHQWLVCNLCNKKIDPLRENLNLVIQEDHTD